MLHQHECALELTTCAATRKKRWGFAGAALGWGVFFPEALSVRLSHTLVNPFLLNQLLFVFWYAFYDGVSFFLIYSPNF